MSQVSHASIELVDTHQHLWDLARHSYSWCAGIPTLNRSFVMSDYLAAVGGLPGGARITRSVHVEADVDEPFMEAETQWVLGLAAAPDNPMAGVVACCRPERPEHQFRTFIDRFAPNPYLKGVRRVLHTQPDDLSSSALFAANVRSLAQHRLTFDLCVLPRQLPAAAQLVRKCLGVNFVLDHCGVPDIKGRALDPWRANLREISALPNVVACKVSGLVAYADPQRWTPADLKPFVDHALECFGWDRVMFGSDWPVCTLSATLGRWVGALLELTVGALPEQRRRLFTDNAVRVYRLGPR